jgi:putative ABC transport system ATP-binding protein
MIEFRNITKTYYMGENTFQALKGISFKVEEKDMLAIVGPSGSGKTTTMNIIGLLARPTTGQYLIHDKDVSGLSSNALADLRNHEIGFVFQSFNLLPRLDAIHNVMLPLGYRPGVPYAQRKKRAQQCLEKVGMGAFGHHKPTELSGGQQQRVAIARALIGDPSLILADEPTGALDSKTSRDVMALLKNLNEEDGCTIVMITHDEGIAKQFPRNIHVYDGEIVDEPHEQII